MKITFLIALTITAMTAPLRAQSRAMDTTDALASACRLYVQMANKTLPATNADKYTQAGFCIGYMAGFTDDATVARTRPIGTPNFCLPDSINPGEVVKAFLKYVHGHPQERQLSGKITVPRALQQAYPCRGQQ